MSDSDHRKLVDSVREVLRLGGQKHGDDWKTDPNYRDRYMGKLLGHFARWLKGEQFDAETGMHPLYHVAANAVLLAARERLDRGKQVQLDPRGARDTPE
jgi:hypothetical protein